MNIFNLPDLGEGLPEGEIHEWYVKEGDDIKADQPMVAIETAKAIVDVPAPQSGKVAKLFGKAGDIIKTGAPLIGFEGEATAKKTAKPKDKGTVVGAIEVGEKIIEESATGVAQVKEAARVKVMPAVRLLARNCGIDLNTVTPTGPNGTITTQDVQNALQGAVKIPEGAEELHGPRRVMAHTMAKLHKEVVPVTLVDDASLAAWQGRQDITLRLIRAIVKACQTEPALNAHFFGDSLSRKVFDEIHLGLALDTPNGLYVPVLKNIHQSTAKKARAEIDEFKVLAKHQAITPEQMQGATITLSNFGVFAGRYANPVVVPPSVCIIGAGRLYQNLYLQDDQLYQARMLPLSLTFDHRAATGGEAARFLKALIDDLQAVT